MFITYILFSLTYSRSGYLAFISSFGYLSIIRRSPKLVVLAVIAILVTILILPRSPGGEGVKLERTSSIEARIKNWKNSFQIFRDHPVIGVGFNTYRYSQNKYGFLDKETWLKSHAGAGADSSLLFVAATTGIMGLAAYLVWIKNLWKQAKSNHLAKATLVALFVHSIFLNSAFYPFILFWTFVVLSSKETN
jgi:O-antigen ligase